jgi:hypothetical protein
VGKSSWRGWICPLNSNYCIGQENLDVYTHSPMRLHCLVTN